MKLTQIVPICAALAMAVLLAGCAKPPTEEMDRATEAVTLAENDLDAVLYGSNSLTRAREALTRMQAEAASKRYDAAKSYAAEAIAAAERSIAEGRTGAARARDEATALVSQLRPLIAETSQGIDAARAAGLPLDFDAIDREFDNALANTNEAQAALSARQYQGAITRGRNARAGLNNINQQLSSVVISVTVTK